MGLDLCDRRPFCRVQSRGARSGLTLIEVLVVVAIIGVLSGIAYSNFADARIRAKVAASKERLRIVGSAIETYCVDHGAYPVPSPSIPDDPLGVLAASALAGLTTPVAYLSPGEFRDPFGGLQLQIAYGGGAISLAGVDPFRPPAPESFNKEQSLLYIHYPTLSSLLGDPALRIQGYSTISIGPDLKDSLIAFYPVPASLPPAAAQFGIHSGPDTVYDPTNGTYSAGDIAWFGGMLPVTQLVGGGN